MLLSLMPSQNKQWTFSEYSPNHGHNCFVSDIIRIKCPLRLSDETIDDFPVYNERGKEIPNSIGLTYQVMSVVDSVKYGLYITARTFNDRDLAAAFIVSCEQPKEDLEKHGSRTINWEHIEVLEI